VHVAPSLTKRSPRFYVARSAGFDCARVELAGCSDKAEFLARIAAALGFPAWFGHNWECIFGLPHDLSWRPALGYVLILEHATELKRPSRGCSTHPGNSRRRSYRLAGSRAPFRAFVSIASVSTGA